jgi:hypothetical protein
MDLIWIFLLIGLGLGSILSLLFSLFSKTGTTTYSRTLYGIESTELITNIIVMFIGASLIVLSVVSFLVKDVTYPQRSPLYFTIETLLMALLSSVIIFLMTYFRGYKFTISTIEEFFILFLKFGILHILLQFSGFYSYIFASK